MASGPTELLIDEERFLLTVEVLLANIPSLVSDLSSAKYALLSFSDKFRNEVRQKSSLIPAVSDAYREFLEMRGSLQEEQRKLNELETQLVRSSPPNFLSVEEVHFEDTGGALLADEPRRSDGADAQEESLIEENLLKPHAASAGSTVSTAEGLVNIYETQKNSTLSDAASQTALVLSADDIKRVRESESLLEEEREKLACLARETNVLEDQLELDRSRCEEMSEHVHSIRRNYLAVLTELTAVESERRQYATLREEWEGRKGIYSEARRDMEEIFVRCRHEELAIISVVLEGVHEHVISIERELNEKKRSQEVELAVYQIAYKEQQAVVDELRDAVSYLQRHQWELELMAKRQEIEKYKRKSIRRLLMASLSASLNTGEALTQELREEYIKEAKEDHRAVSFVSARIGALEARRGVLAAELLRISSTEKDTTRVNCALRRIREILMDEITIDESMLQNEDELTPWYNRELLPPHS
ncbi:hypothetical protein TcYC6_0096880 [Trypanosoma cruzi]|uniref:Uncharacterized protein n=1 Tax=Trypanosoma cruzi TaxID=5693 RepID=A0A7J6YK44_TRYCR|nr:hypothetical protein ECC02_000314 [Trypanosoma cruzi]KAF8295139.1 hypothetical protein TcYC6_0096880 [Trypanosoma cruzi]